MPILKSIGNAIDKAGTRFGLPELGISERIAGGRTVNTKSVASPIPQIGRSPSISSRPAKGSVMGASVGPVGGGYSPAGGGGQPTNFYANAPQDVFEPYPDQGGGIDFDALIAPALQALDASIAPLQAEYETTAQGIETNRARRAQEAQTNIAGQQSTLDTARTRQQQSGESAANEARRQFAEMQQGLQARYGGTTGTGGFASELAGRETFRNIGQIRTALSGALQEIDSKKQQVQEIGRIALADIEDQAVQQKNEAKNNLDSQLADIRRQKGELQSRKAELAMQAMQFYQQQVAQINQRNASFKQDLYVRQQAAEQQLQEAMSRAKGTAQSFTPQDLVSLVGDLSPLQGSGFQPSLSGSLQTSGGGKVQFGLDPQEEEEKTGNWWDE